MLFPYIKRISKKNKKERTHVTYVYTITNYADVATGNVKVSLERKTGRVKFSNNCGSIKIQFLDSEGVVNFKYMQTYYQIK